MSSEITINSNIASIQTQRRLGQSSSSLNRVFERLSSGQRINHASDDAAGLAISDSLRGDRRVLIQGVRNLNDGMNLITIGEGALSEQTNIVTRVLEIAEQAANGTLGFRQRESLDKEAQQLSKEFTRIAQTAEFNGIRIFDGSVSNLRLQAGYGNMGGLYASIGGTKGTGSFSGQVSFAAETLYTTRMTLGDLNRDGNLDLVTTGSDGSGGRASVRLGDGSGNFGARVSFLAEVSSSNDVALSDLNGDGILDIVTAGDNGGIGAATVRLGLGNGNFGSSTSYTSESNYSYGLALGDLNSDGVVDLVTSGFDAGFGRATVRLGMGNGTFGAATSYLAETGFSNAAALGDLNGDGTLDLVTAGGDGFTGWATIRLGRGNGTFGAETSYSTEAFETARICLEDLNQDGIIDLVTAGHDGGVSGVTIRLGTGNGNFGVAITYATESSESAGLRLGDFNGDGSFDLVTVGQEGAAGAVTVRLGAGNGTFGNATKYSTVLDSMSGVAIGDLNGDGVLDLAASGDGGGSGTAIVFYGDASNGVGALLPFSFKYRHTALQAMPDLSRALNRISAHRGYLGAFQSRIGSAINNVQITIENYAAGESQIRDTDVAQDAANLAKGRIVQQAAASVLAQANLEPQIALTLLQAGPGSFN